jgi:hypothetical protein
VVEDSAEVVRVAVVAGRAGVEDLVGDVPAAVVVALEAEEEGGLVVGDGLVAANQVVVAREEVAVMIMTVMPDSPGNRAGKTL